MTKGAGRRRMLKPLVPVYAVAIAAKERLLAWGWPRVRRLKHPVISIGSLSAGGAGKTPVVLMMAELLADCGYEVRILTRGYGRSGRGVERVDPDGDAGRYGDEPVMLARRVPSAAVWVGADRWEAGRVSEREDEPGRKVVYLLDDGFQHRRLARDVDVVVLTRQELEDELLPAGNLREPLKAIGRADVVVLREEEGFAGALSGQAATWYVSRKLVLQGPVPTRAVGFCGLARPDGFFAMLAADGTDLVARSTFRDHHAYSAVDIERLVELARLHGADGFVTTEKDAVKLSARMRERLGLVAVAELRVELRDAEIKIREIVGLLGG